MGVGDGAGAIVQGIGTAVLIGTGNKTSGEINFMPLLCGRTLKGTIYGGIKTKSDLPILFDKCLNKVSMLLLDLYNIKSSIPVVVDAYRIILFVFPCIRGSG